MNTPYRIDTSQGCIAVTGPTLKEPRAFHSIAEAKLAAGLLNDAWNDGWHVAFRERR